MGIFRNLSVSKKLILLSILLPAVMIGILFAIFVRNEHEGHVSNFVDQSRAICLTAESTRENMEKKWELGLFTAEHLKTYAEKGERQKLLASIPVVSAWEAAMQKAQQGGYEFRVPKFQPRNPKNEPDEIEARALKTMEEKRLDEYYEIDTEANTVRYFRPIKLSTSCLNCHGDPATSKALWGNDQGLDPTGTKMENWKVGEIHGAFEVVMSLKAADAETAADIRDAAMLVLFMLLGGGVIAFFFARGITKPLSDAVEVIRGMAEGDLSQRVAIKNNDEIGALSNAFNTMADNLEAKARVAEAIAAGNLNVAVNITSEKDTLGKSIRKMVGNLRDMIGKLNGSINESVEQVASGSDQITSASQALSQGATEQASSLEEITSSMTEIRSQTKTNAENASQANNMAKSVREEAEKGNITIQSMVGAMGEINASSQQIAKIIKVIDDIAFQTNLLALNAAVEAARAGKHGKGFAVVADEVRNLASRSAKAARETADLIDASGKKVENGQSVAGRTAETFKEIVNGITKVTDLVGEIAAASNEQAQGIAQVSQGLQQIDQVTQQNTASAEETASAAEELSSQAAHLRQLMQQFKLGSDGGTGESVESSAPAAPAPRVKIASTINSNGWGKPFARPRSEPHVPTHSGNKIALDDNELGR